MIASPDHLVGWDGGSRTTASGIEFKSDALYAMMNESQAQGVFGAFAKV